MDDIDESISNSRLSSGWESVDEEYKPKVGLTFSSLQEAEDFYRQYAKLVGFSVRKYATMVDKSTNNRYSQQFVCSKQGMPREKSTPKEGEKKRNRAITRENCLAGIRFQKDPDEKWSVRRFFEAHTHPCVTPRKQQFLRSNRTVSEAKKSLINTFKEANLRPSQCMSYLEIESGGYSDIGCTEKDIRNALQKEREEKKVYDAQLLMEHLKEEQEINPSFYYAYKVDNNNKLTHVFWADGFARKAYHHFGNVLIFDTTYDTNKYRLVFSPFTGVNHHGQSVNFGAGFIKDEKIDSFIWLFEKWQEAMCGHPPSVIITDQDSSIGAAIQEKFPKSNHRYCMWHILKKLLDKLGATAYKSEFSIPFQKCVWNSETSEEFESQWKDTLNDNKLDNNEWLSNMYEIREKWIPAFGKNMFTAGIRTTQRSESMNAYIDKYVNNMNTLAEFVVRLERAMRRQRQNELAVDYETFHNKPRLHTELEMEKQMSVIYTRENFYVFQEEIVHSMSYASLMKEDDGNSRKYIVKWVGKSIDSERNREEIYRGTKECALCSCKKLESEGIPCRHILVVL